MQEDFTAPSGHRYRVRDGVLEVRWDGGWVQADQVDAADVVALMEWARAQGSR